MVRLRHCAAWGALLPTLLGVTADAAEAPLQSTRQELRKLEDSQKASTTPSAKDGLTSDLPAIQTPGQEVLPFSQITAAERREKERERKQDAQKNWLLNGVDKLAKSSAAKPADNRKETEVPASNHQEENAVQADDPQYLLKMYDEQARAEEARHPQERTQSTSRANPLAPFLNDWLGNNSPVRGQFFDEFVNKPSSDAGLGSRPVTASGALGSVDHNFAPTATAPTASGEPHENPYLLAATTPSQAGLSSPNPGTPPSGMGFTDNPANVVNQPPMPVLTPVPAEAPPPKKPQTAPWTDEGKYFPQLKKF